MNILSIETSSPILSVAVKKGSACTEINFKKGRYHAENLVPLVDRALRKLKLSAKKLDVIMCGVGPGSFTGLRIGLSAAKGFSLGLGVSVMAVSSLDLIAEGAKLKEGLLAVILDARRERFYAAFYKIKSGRRKKVLKDSILTLDELKARLPDVTHMTGDGLRVYSDKIKSEAKGEIVFLHEKFWYPRASSAFQILEQKKKIEATQLSRLKPAYLRLTEAEERRRNAC